MGVWLAAEVDLQRASGGVQAGGGGEGKASKRDGLDHVGSG